MEKSVVILEKSLQFWEDRHLLNKIAQKVHGLDMPTSGIHFNQFRKYLRDGVIHDTNLEDARFGFKEAFMSNAMKDDDIMNMFAYCMASWVRESRRVFSVERDLQAMLDSTTLSGVTYADIKFPFRTFMVSLEKPLINEDGEKYSSILLCSHSHEGSKESMWCYLFADESVGYSTLNASDRAELDKALAKGNSTKAHKIGLKLQNHQDKYPWLIFCTRKFFPHELVEENLTNSKDMVSIFESATRIALGLCLYMKTLPVASPHVSNWKSSGKVPSVRGNAVSTDSQVCSVSSVFKLTNEERKAFEDPDGCPTRTFGEKCCHFRRGTWCRPKGSAPDAKKTEWRRPTVVRKDKLEPGTLPKGAETILGLAKN